MATTGRRNRNRQIDRGIPIDVYGFSKRGRDFVQAVARGLGDGVRNTAHKLNEADLIEVLQFEVFRDLIEALGREADWRPKPDAVFDLFGPLDPEQKKLRATTLGAIRKARSTARRLVADTSAVGAPNVDGTHYQVAKAVTGVLKTIPSVSQVFLFGSVARGEEGDASDVDLLVVRAPGLSDARFRDLACEALAEIADLMEFPVLKIRPDAFDRLSQSPDVHLLMTLGHPKRWSDQGVVGEELVSLWHIDSPQELVAARGNGAEVFTNETGSALLHEMYWHWRGGGIRGGFQAEAIIEVGIEREVELRLVEVITPWFVTENEEFRAWLKPQGGRTTEWSDDVQNLAFDAIVHWVEVRTGRMAPEAEFSVG